MSKIDIRSINYSGVEELLSNVVDDIVYNKMSDEFRGRGLGLLHWFACMIRPQMSSMVDDRTKMVKGTVNKESVIKSLKL